MVTSNVISTVRYCSDVGRGLHPLRHTILFVFLLAVFTSCANHQLSIKGDNADVHLVGGGIVSGELLLLSDTALFVLSESHDGERSFVRQSEELVRQSLLSGEYCQIALAKIIQISINGYANHNWWWLASINLLGGVLVAAEAASSSLTFGLIFLAIPVLDLILFATSEPNNPEITAPLDALKRAELKKYLRLPQEFDSLQVKAILKQLGNPKEHIIK